MPDADDPKTAWVARVLGVVARAGGAAQTSAAGSLAELEPRYHAALRAAPEERSGLVAAWEFAAEGGTIDPAAAARAIASLAARIDAALARPAASDAEKFGIQVGIVAERRTELETYFAQQIGEAKTEILGEIGKLTRALEEFIEEPEALVAAVRGEIAKLLDGLEKELGASVASGTEDEVGEIMDAWNERIQANPVVGALRDACDELEVAVSFDVIIDTLMIEIVKKLDFAAA